MFHSHKILLASVVASSLASLALAQTAAPMVACDAQFATLDVDANGYLSETEAPREYARARVDAMTMDAKGLGKEAMMTQCNAVAWSAQAMVDGAPLEGANSFTEAQAQDRALSWNLTKVSALVLDDKGIWRGTAMKDSAQVSVAVDFKGNVTTTPES